ncbi:MAG: hypothetical protein QXN08_01120 [Nitrososphaerales archaeon]
MKIIFSERCLEYGSWHIESPHRVRKAYEVLRQEGYEFLTPTPASEEDVLRVHAQEYVNKLKSGLLADADTPAYEGIYEYARLAAGGAILAAQTNGFSLMRPPGHHAGRGGAALGAHTRGFCYLNNIAIAVKYINRPALILDIDGHHGNGTQEIFQGYTDVTYISLHRYPNYPGTGLTSVGNCLNYPLWADCGEEEYLKTLKDALQNCKSNRFEVVAVSAGFDTYRGDLASLNLTESTYRKIGRLIKSLNKPTFFVLEGGYLGEELGRSIHNLITGFEET